MTKTALITGVTGQDGAYLTKFLLEKGYEVYGVFRRISTPNFWRLQRLGVFDQIRLISADLSDTPSLVDAVHQAEPDEIYHLAAQSFVGASFEQPVMTGDVSGISVTRLLEIIRHDRPQARLYQAATSEIYGDGHDTPLTETSSFQPSSPYATAKLYAYWMVRSYRTGYNLFASNGILFNHESPLRGLEFVTRKITNGVAKIHHGLAKEIRLGNLDTRRDWGYAPDYVDSMWRILQQDKPDDFVVATNESHSVREFAELAFKEVGLDWKDHVVSDAKLRRPVDVQFLQGDYSKAETALGWKPTTTFRELVRVMVREDLACWKRYLSGELFPWDAFTAPTEFRTFSRRSRA